MTIEISGVFEWLFVAVIFMALAYVFKHVNIGMRDARSWGAVEKLLKARISQLERELAEAKATAQFNFECYQDLGKALDGDDEAKARLRELNSLSLAIGHLLISAGYQADASAIESLRDALAIRQRVTSKDFKDVIVAAANRVANNDIHPIALANMAVAHLVGDEPMPAT